MEEEEQGAGQGLMLFLVGRKILRDEEAQGALPYCFEFIRFRSCVEELIYQMSLA